jgi:AraC-like DNA-binding protein
MTALKKALGNETEIVALNRKTISYDIKAKANDVRIMIADCDYSCVFDKCLSKFILFHRNYSIPFVILRPSLFKITNTKLYYLSVLDDCNLSEDQEGLIQKLRSSELSVVNPRLFVHPSNPIYKLMQVEKEIVENPSKRIVISSLTQSVRLSESWLSLRFRKLCNIGLDAFIRKNVFCHALWELITTQNSIKSIAIEHGYCPNSFSNQFTMRFGKSPNIVRSRTLKI